MLAFAGLPFAVYFGLQHFEARAVALVLLAALLLRMPSRINGFLQRLGWRALAPGIALVAAGALLWRSNDPVLVLLYPVAVNVVMLVTFFASLIRPPSIVERIARVSEPNLPAAAVAYTRRVTQLWCLFFVANGILSAWSALAASRETWVFYNGFLAYVLIGTLFAGEWLYRRWRFGVRPARARDSGT